MATNEPSLSELTNIQPNAAIGGSESTPVIDNTKIVDNLNQNARYQAENAYRKYNQFLENKKELFKNISDIQGLETAPEDRDILQKQAADVLGTILKDPSVITGGRGYDELQGKISKFKADAMLSKQNKLDYDSNELFMARNPELYTDENKGLQETFLKSPLGTRKTIQLQMPTIFDEKGAIEGIIKSTTQPYTDIVGADGKPGQGYIETGNEVNPNAISSLWNLALKGQKDKYGHSIMGAVKSNYNALPDEVKAQYDKNGGIEKFFEDRGQQYLKAYFPPGSYDQTPEGNYRFGKKLTADPNYLGAERLSLQQRELNEKSANDKAQRAIGWAHIGIERDKLNKADKEDQDAAATVLNQMSGAINNGTPKTIVSAKDGSKMDIIRISDPLVLQKFQTLDKEGKAVNSIDAIDFDPKTSQLYLQFFAKNNKGTEQGGNKIVKTIPMDQRVWSKIVTAASFPNKEIGGINTLLESAFKANNNSIFDIAQKFKGQRQTQPQQTAPANTPNAAKTVKINGYEMPIIK